MEVIIENRADYVRAWEDVSIFPEALTALAQLAAGPYKIVIVTNQSGIGKGLIPPQTAEQINQRLLEAIHAAGGRIDGVYVCPHTPEDNCTCRKPRPGLILQASRELSLDLGHSIMIGDALSDIQAGQAAGISRNVLVLTGRGAKQSRLPEAAGIQPFLISDSFHSAVKRAGRPSLKPYSNFTIFLKFTGGRN